LPLLSLPLPAPAVPLRLSHDGYWLAIAGEGTAGAKSASLSSSSSSSTSASSSSTRVLSRAVYASVYDTRTGILARVCDAEAGSNLHRMRICDLGFYPRLLSNSHSSSITTATATTTSHSVPALLTASIDGTVHVWAEQSPSPPPSSSSDHSSSVPHTSTLLSSLHKAHGKMVGTSLFSSDGCLLITAAQDKSVRFWQLPFSPHPAPSSSSSSSSSSF
jgi:WD40 repeat protein